MTGEGRPPQAPADRQHAEDSAPRPTPEQARRELARRAGGPEAKAAGRRRAIEDGTFGLTGSELAEIAEGEA